MKRIVISLFMLTFLFSCDDIVEVEDISKQQVVILAPTNNSVLTENNIIFSWNVLEEIDRYHLQVATPSFENASQIVVDSLVIATNLSSTLSAGNYQWRVRAENSEYETVYTTQSFIVE